MSDGEKSAERVWMGRDFWAGIALVALGAGAFVAARELPFMTRSGVGAGLLPQIVAGFVAALGVAQTLLALRDPGPTLARWAWREIAIVLGAVVLFGLTIRGFDAGMLAIPPLGLAVAGPLAVVAAGLADRDSRPGELVLFGIAMTLACAGLFRYALGLPIPIAPWLIGY